MGDGDINASGGKTHLIYVPLEEIERLRQLPHPADIRTAMLADVFRLNALYMIKRAGSGHIGTSFSSIDVVAWLFTQEMRVGVDAYFSSKGHDAPALYATLTGLGLMPIDEMHALRRLGGLPGHPHVGHPHIHANTGSLGMGISKAKGMVTASRLQGRQERVFVLTGDGELQEGQIWESLPSAVASRMEELTVIVDHNKIQSDTWVKDVSDLGDLERKFRAFGWHVERCDGHDPSDLRRAIRACDAAIGKPRAIIADTVKGKGAGVFEPASMAPGEWRYKFHSGAPSDELYAAAVNEIQQRIESRAGSLRVVSLPQPEHRAIAGLQKLIPAYTDALLRAAERDARIVALDADLILDTGLIPFREHFPDRFVECGIAEQDMVSQAGGMALRGLVPIAHSFSCFLTTRPNEQIYNNATEGTKVIYVGSLAGLVPGGPGHSHQSVRDISTMGAIPGLVAIEPCHEREVGLALEYLLQRDSGSGYLRLVSIACDVPYELPADHTLVEGRGVELRAGRDGVIIAYGPVLLAEAWRAAERLEREGLSLAVVNLPWLNRVDPRWLEAAVGGRRWLFTLDNHYVHGGQGELVLATLAELHTHEPPRAKRLGLTAIPACGKNDEVLRHHRLDAESLAEDIRAFTEKHP